MNTTPSSSPSGRALVLGGGGSTGNAWLIGVIAGLADAGLDATAADAIIGTSAGSTAAAQITGAAPAALLADILTATIPPRPPRPAGAPAPSRAVSSHLERADAILAAATDAADMRRRMGAAALAADAVPDFSARWRSTVAARLPRQQWPAQRVLITAVDAATGEPVVFDRDSGIDLADAVAASCSSSVAYRIGDAAYIDGGYRSNADNADLAAGYARVLSLSPFGGRTRTPAAWRLDLATQIDDLRAGGSRVEAITPDADADHLFGVNAMNPALRPAAARAGYDQGLSLGPGLLDFWG